MSNSTTSDPLPLLRSTVDAPPVRRGVNVVAAPLRFVGFWLAVALPFLYLPLLYGGLEGNQAVVFGALLALNAAALLAGHSYRQ